MTDFGIKIQISKLRHNKKKNWHQRRIFMYGFRAVQDSIYGKQSPNIQEMRPFWKVVKIAILGRFEKAPLKQNGHNWFWGWASKSKKKKRKENNKTGHCPVCNVQKKHSNILGRKSLFLAFADIKTETQPKSVSRLHWWKASVRHASENVTSCFWYNFSIMFSLPLVSRFALMSHSVRNIAFPPLGS